MEPISERYDMANSVIIGEISLAISVIVPSNANTGMAEKALPFPRDDVMTTMIMKSRTAFIASCSDHHQPVPKSVISYEPSSVGLSTPRLNLSTTQPLCLSYLPVAAVSSFGSVPFAGCSS